MDYTLSDYSFFLTVKAYLINNLPAIITIFTILGVFGLFFLMISQLLNDEQIDNLENSRTALLPNVQRQGKMDIERAVLVIHRDESTGQDLEELGERSGLACFVHYE